MREIRVADAIGSEAPALVEYREVIDDLRSGFLSAPPEEVVQRHLADIFVVLEATRYLSRDARRRRRSLVFGSTLGLGAVLAGGGAAAAASGSLPGPAQQFISRVAEPLGIDLPAGHSDDAPGRGGDNPGQSGSAPGQQADPGNSENAPGHGGDNPGRSDTAPGHSDNTDNTDNAPTTLVGRSGAVGTAPAVPPGLQDGTGKPADPGAEGKGTAKNDGSPSTYPGDSGTPSGNANASGEPKQR